MFLKTLKKSDVLEIQKQATNKNKQSNANLPKPPAIPQSTANMSPLKSYSENLATRRNRGKWQISLFYFYIPTC